MYRICKTKKKQPVVILTTSRRYTYLIDNCEKRIAMTGQHNNLNL